MSPQLDRPERPARRPRPAADEGQDPVDYRPAAQSATSDEGKGAQAPAAAATEQPEASKTRGSQVELRVAKREATVQLATRISPETDAILTATAARTGATKRALIEEAIRNAWG